MLAAVVTPLLPVSTTSASLSWPQGQQLRADDPSVSAPLVAQTAKDLDIVVSCRALASLPREGGTVLSTMPPGASRAANKALTVSASETSVSVMFRSNLAATASRADIAAGKCTRLHVFSSATATGASFDGLTPGTALEPDKRPQVDGLFTALSTERVEAMGDGIRAHVTIDNRYESSPSAVKIAAMVIAVLATLLALLALWCLDVVRGYTGSLLRRSGSWLSRLAPRASDAVVGGVLLVWTFLGAGAPDDGYILTMGRTAADAGYMPNYYRFFGIAEAPFDWYYSFLSIWSSVSDTILWMHIPQLVAGVVSWLVLSRIVLPHLGESVAANPWARWTAGAVFLSFWLPFCSGLRTEGVIVLGTLLTWWATESAITRRRVLPAALAAAVAALTLALAPQGVVAAAVLLVAARPMLSVLIERRREAGLVPLLAPIAAAATVGAVVVFRDQTLMTVLESMKIRYQTGPILSWHQEFLRYYFLAVNTPDGALARRIPVLLMVVAAVLVAAVLVRRGGIPGVSASPTWRMVGAFGIGLLLMFVTPNKWTIQLGVFAGLGAALAAVATIAIAESGARSLRNLAALTAGLLFALAAAAAGTNAWPYAYNFGIPWFDEAPTVAGRDVSTILLALAVVSVAVTLWLHLRSDYVANRGLAHHGEGGADTAADRRRIAMASTPLLVIATLMVVATLVAFGRAAVVRTPAMTVASTNLATVTGQTCGMADQVLAEPDPNAGFLTPADGRPVGRALAGESPIGFTPAGVPDDLSPDNKAAKAGQMHVGGSTSKPFAIIGGLGAGTTGGRGPETVNGSRAALPFGLDPAVTPVLGSFGHNANAYLTTGWYDLPDRDASPLIAFATAGAVSTIAENGEHTYGQKLVAQFGTRDGGDFRQIGGDVTPIDPGPVFPQRPWRNLRIPMSEVPDGATAMRLVLADTNLGPTQFIVITPPRAPRLVTLQEMIGRDDPALIDFPVAAQFPCQRPMAITHGVLEVPRWRILPDYVTANSQSKTWMAASGGGPLAVVESMTKQVTVPTYLTDDWHRDWGSVERLRPLAPAAGKAAISTEPQRTWGFSRSPSIRLEPSK